MDFFIVQKKIVRLWFILGGIVFVLTAVRTLFADLHPVSEDIWKFLGIYFAPIYLLIIGSTFFKAAFYTRTVDKIYFHLAFYTSLIYLLLIIASVIVVPTIIRQDNDILSGEAKRNALINTIDNCGLIAKFILPVLTGVLAYFFYKSKEKN